MIQDARYKIQEEVNVISDVYGFGNISVKS
jgi:hypothetical protein